MIYTLLYISPILRGNKNRNIYMYVIGTCVYAIIHCILFSTLGEKNEFVRKYRNAIYAIVACDLIYIKYKYDIEAKAIQRDISHQTNNSIGASHKTTPHIEQVEDTEQVCNGQVCSNTQPPKACSIVNDSNSNCSLPVYVPQISHPNEDNVDIPVYESNQHN